MSGEKAVKDLERIASLYEIANEAGITVSGQSERDLRAVLACLAPQNPAIFLDDEGHFSIVIEGNGARLSLRLQGGYIVKGTVLPSLSPPST